MAYYPHATEVGARYVLTSPEGFVAVFNDPIDPNYVGALTEVTGLDSPEIRESAIDLPQSDGGVHGDFFLGRRPIVMTGRVFNHATIAQRTARLDLARRASLALRGDSTLTWKPSQRQENLLSNPSFEVNTVGYSGTAATFSRQTGIAGTTGTQAFRSTATAASNYGFSVTPTGGQLPIAVQPGQTYTFSIDVLANASVRNVKPSIDWLNASAGLISTSAGTNTTTTGRKSVTAVAPAGAVTARPTFLTTGGVINEFIDVDALRFTSGTSTTYVDGTTTGFYWQGAAHNSASGDFIELMASVRRQQPFRESGAWVKEFQIPLVSQYGTIWSVQQQSATVASGGSTTCENRGNFIATPIISITGTSSNPIVTNTTNGSAVRTVGLSLASGETMAIDTLNHTASFTAGARSGQAANQYINYATTTDWFDLPLGTNTVTLSGGGNATVVWRDTWA